MYTIRPIQMQDNEAVAQIIRTVMPEFGAVGKGYAIEDAEVDMMYEAYQSDKTAYFVIEKEQKIWGGGGIAPLANADGTVCELRKMYFLPEARGKGLGQQMLNKCLEVARQIGYQQCYLETLTKMETAQQLYQKNGFKKLNAPLGNTGHFSCDMYYVLEL